MNIRASAAALGLILSSVAPSQLQAREGIVPSETDPVMIISQCPFYDLPRVVDLREAIQHTYDGTISSDPLPFALSSFHALLSFHLPQLHLLTGNWKAFDGSLVDQKLLRRLPPDHGVFSFHRALRGRDADAMREIAAGGPQRESQPILAPIAELPELAALYAALFDQGDGLEAALDRLSRTAAARAAALARAPDDRQREQRRGDRERISLAWLYFHLARIAAQVPGRGGSSAGYLAQGASLLSAPCQPRMLEYFRSIARGQSPCEGGDLAEEVDVYVCWLPEAILRPAAAFPRPTARSGSLGPDRAHGVS
ncbi:hypothetical protein [Sphingosinicella sp. CPCC 101087]|uniref:hypothetical protein n=1 Tax=Sphingosinicella sp. CPCC 101087 TaxID=2497754 RepID=UPI00101BEEF5|nr:hypothetical protein [Sphingosinicella sp. CPCC 101087]